MKRNFAFFAALALMAGATLTSCQKEGTDDNDGELGEEELLERRAVNTFAYNMMSTYYLWNEEIADDLEKWETDDEPITKVQKLRYKDSQGNDIDRWTQLTDDYDSFVGSVSGTSSTYGFEFMLYYYDSSMTTVCAVVTLVYAGSPADKAGIERGDCILQFAGNSLTASNYYSVLTNEFYGKSSCTLTFYGGGSVTLTQVEMYEDPVILYKTFDCAGKKVGYLVYTSFTLKSYERLIQACKQFKSDGVSELILDLRHNGGGYSLAEQTLASMIAPETEVNAGSIFETEVYNKNLTEAWGTEGIKFTTEFSYTDEGKEISYSTAGANIGLDKIYVLTSDGTASASESLAGCLMPYMEVELIGEQTYGKYCSGIISNAEDWYEKAKEYLDAQEYSNGKKYADGWGIYVMIGRFADKDGETACMPDGLVPDTEVYDNPIDGCQLGDPNETVLAIALKHAGYVAASTSSVKPAAVAEGLTPLPADRQIRKPGFGMKID